MTDAVRMLSALTSIRSVTGTPGELEAIRWLENALAARGIPSERIGDADRPNLIAKLSGNNPALRPLVLLSHIDVVPADETAWSQPPFGGVIDGGRLYGRGTLDTKQLTVMELLAFLDLAGRGAPERDVYFVATVDEEKGSERGAGLLKKLRPELFRGAVVFSEGGGFPLRIGAKPYLTMTCGEKAACPIRLSAKGQAGHASAPGDAQAVAALSRGLRAVLEGVSRLPKAGTVRDGMASLIGEAPDNALASELLAYSGSCGIGMRAFKIGEKVNVLPAEASVELELRPLPGTSREDVKGWLAAWLRGTGSTCEILSYQQGFCVAPDDPLALLIIRRTESAAAARGFPARVLPMLALGRTDGRFFGQEGSLVLGFSPLLMEDAFDKILPTVHGADESVSVDGLTFGCGLMRDLVRQLATEVDQ